SMGNAVRLWWSSSRPSRASSAIGGALGGIVGRLAGDYSQVPALVGVEHVPGPDELKHFGAAMASFGSGSLFHIAGVTPEAMQFADLLPQGSTLPRRAIGEADFRAFQARYARDIGAVDLVVFSAPQLSLMEMRRLPVCSTGAALKFRSSRS